MGISVVITRPDGPYAGARHMREALVSAGCEPFLFPVLRCERLPLAPDQVSAVRTAIARPGQWLVFLSPTAVAVFSDLLRDEFAGAALAAGVKIAVQGKGSSEVVRDCFGRQPDFVPSVFVAEHFADEFSRRVSSDAPVLVAQSREGRNVFSTVLEDRGFVVNTIETYTTQRCQPPATDIARVVQLASESQEAYIIFMSPSAVAATVAALNSHQNILERLSIVSVGPITTQAVRKHGLRVAAEAAEHSEEGAVRALRELINR